MQCLEILQLAKCLAFKKKVVSISWAANLPKLRDDCRKVEDMEVECQELIL